MRDGGMFTSSANGASPLPPLQRSRAVRSRNHQRSESHLLGLVPIRRSRRMKQQPLVDEWRRVQWRHRRSYVAACCVLTFPLTKSQGAVISAVIREERENINERNEERVGLFASRCCRCLLEKVIMNWFGFGSCHRMRRWRRRHACR